MLLLRLSYLDRTVELEELIRGLGGAPVEGPRRRASEPAAASPAPTPQTDEVRAPLPSGDDAPAPDEAAADTGTDARPGDAPSDDAPPDDAPSDDVTSGDARPDDAPPEDPSLAEAWSWALRRVAPPTGLGTFLRAAEVEAGEGRRIVVTLDAAAAERFERAEIGADLAAALGRALGRDVTLAVGAREPDGERITQDTVREGRLREYIAEEPLLEHAVLELDLELLD